MSLLICLIAVLSVVTTASPVPDAEVGLPSPLNAITDLGFGSYPSPPQNLGGNIASQDALVLADIQDLSTAWQKIAPIPQSYTLAQPIFDSNSNHLAQAHFEDEKSSSSKSGTPTPFQKYWHAECGGTQSVCCSGIGIDISNNEQPGVPLPCSDSMQFSLVSSPTSNKGLILHKENIKMVDAGYEQFLWPGDSRTERYCLQPVYLTDCNTVFVSFFSLYPPLLFSQTIHYHHHQHREF